MGARHWLILVLIATMVAGCGEATDSTGGVRSPSAAPSLAGLVDAAVSDLADRFGVGTNEITVVSAETVTWDDASLGCPQPGEVYAQVRTEGARVVLEHEDTSYAYHAGPARSDPFLCIRPDGPRPPVEPPITDPAY